MNSVNGVISNGLAPRVFSIVGSVVSANCTWQDGHHDSTCPLLLRASLSSVPSATRPDVATSPARICTVPQQWVGPPIASQVEPTAVTTAKDSGPHAGR